MKVIWADDAPLDIERHMDYIAQFNPVAAATVARYLLDAGNRLALFPHRGPIGTEAGTRAFVAVYPYLLVYEINAEAVAVLRVWHGGQQR